MRVLLDTHTLLWALAEDKRLSRRAHELIVSEDNEVMVSAVSAWEIATKKRLGKLEAPDSLSEVIEQTGFRKRLLTFEDAAQLEQLPLHHRDPFDRMLIAQAVVDGVPLVSRDPAMIDYPVNVLW